ncbi:MAG: glycosyltransferase family 4 protein [Deltaproteobacteria bacterium]|nr:glycosyltransferase family 4 protein [Deltaproteobacteria bacterium]
MRILEIVNGRFYGGGQQVAIDLKNEINARGQAVVELCLLGATHPKMIAEAACSVSYDGKYNVPSSVVAAAARLRRLVRRRRPELIHSHGWDASIVSALALWPSRIPQLVHWHTTDEWLSSDRLVHRARRELTSLLLTQHVVTVSQATKDHLRDTFDWPSERMTVVRNGVDTEKYQAIERREDTAFVVGTAARLSPPKGIEYLLRALAGLPGTWSLRVAGEGSHRSALEACAKELGIAERVEFLGRVDDMAGFYRSIDLFVLPSLTEGLPLCVLEAMASERAVIATNVGGVSEALGSAGLLVPPRDSDALSEKIRLLAENPARRLDLAKHGHARVQAEFSRKVMAESILKLYAGLTTR